MPGWETASATKKYVVVPCLSVGSFLALVAVALSIALIVIQLADNTTINIKNRSFKDMDKDALNLEKWGLTSEDLDKDGLPKHPHPFGPTVVICSRNQEILPETIECYLYPEGKPSPPENFSPIDWNDPFYAVNNSREPCWPESDGVDEGGDWGLFESSLPSPDGDTTMSCLVLKKSSFPTNLGKGAVTEVSFQTKAAGIDILTQFRDDGVYELRMYGANVSLQDVENDVAPDGNVLDDGNFFTVPAAMAATYWTGSDSPGQCVDDPDAEEEDYPPYNYRARGGDWVCVTRTLYLTRAGVGATIELSEVTRREYKKDYEHEFDFSLVSAIPKFNWGYDIAEGVDKTDVESGSIADTSSFASFTFRWDSDVVQIFEEVQVLNGTTMAAILIGSIATALASVAQLIDIYDTYHADPS